MNRALAGRRSFWLYAAGIAAIWMLLVLVVGAPWLVSLLFAAFQVEIVFRVVEWSNRRRLSEGR